MNIIKQFKKSFKFIYDKEYRFMCMGNLGLLGGVPDREYLQKRYKILIGRELDLENPVYYTEKLQWLKINDHNPKYTTMVDKYNVKNYVAERIGQQYVIPTLGVWDDFDDIDFNQLPDKFVLKCTHDSGSIVICKDKAKLDLKKAKRKLNKYMKRNYYICSREWPYKHVEHKIIAEAYMEDVQDGELRDYKFFTFGGEPKVLYIAQGRGRDEETVSDFFDMEFNHLQFTIDHNMAKTLPHPPKNFELMKQFAAKLSEGTPQLRVDFYEVNGQVYFGEMTFFHCSGMTPFHPEEWDKKFGDWVVLPEKRSWE